MSIDKVKQKIYEISFTSILYFEKLTLISYLSINQNDRLILTDISH